ncbi:UNVERIFIED_CONTAM: hypothetical protein GTU68_062414 [Idotea baltica]|nr:hypothetical protein [Idotea baltica]
MRGFESKVQIVLVTGCAGFIAAKVVELLCHNTETTVVGVDNLNRYYDPTLKTHRLKKLSQLPNFQFVELDIEDRVGLGQVFDSHAFTAVMNLAARAGVRYSIERPHLYNATNSGGSLNLLDEMRSRGISKYVLASTSSLYAGQEMPFKETLPVNTPISPYAASKKAAEVMAYAYHHLHEIDVSIVRFFTVFGPAGRPDMSYFRFIQWIYNDQPIRVFGDGEQSRDFTFVDDIARGTIAALQPVGYEVFNLGGGKQPVSINTIIKKLEVLLGKQATVHYEPEVKADMVSTWADIEKARQLLDWRPIVSLDDGLQQTVNWFVKNLPWTAEIAITTPMPDIND